MNPLIVHIGLFLLLAVVIVMMSTFYAEPDDAKALRSLPRRYLKFVGACALIVAAMLAAEWLFLGR